mgnify:FL=1
MKFKDIEKSLKREHDGTQVPDVMKRAQKAPINKLLDGQRPLRAFDKQTAVRVLWIVMALAVTALLCFGALGIMGNGGGDRVSCAYVRVSVENDGEITEYGIVVDGVENVALFVLEKRNGVLIMQDENKSGYSVKNAINEVYQVKNGDKVSICVVGKNANPISEQDLKDAFSANGNEVEMLSANDPTVLSSLETYAQTSEKDIDAIINTYIEKYRK